MIIIDDEPFLNKDEIFLTLFEDAKNNNDFEEYIKYLNIIKRYKIDKNKFYNMLFNHSKY
jgi:hypothetical protein